MKVSDLANIPDPVQRLSQSQRFLRQLEVVENAASEVRDTALVELREEGMSQQAIAELIGISQQRVQSMLKRAERKRADNPNH